MAAHLHCRQHHHHHLQHAAAPQPPARGSTVCRAAAAAALGGRRGPAKRLRWQQWEQRLLERFLQRQAEEQLELEGSSSGSGGTTPAAAAADDLYYSSYWDCPDAHLASLADAPYQAAWAAALEAAAPRLAGGVVLVVGCGLGGLAIAAAKAGAKHVYAVDASRGAVDLAAKVVAANGLASRVTVMHGRAESVELPVRRVDAILCDAAGSMLLHDSLVPALLRARDRLLAPGGLMLPDWATLRVAAVDDGPFLAEQSRLWGGKPLGFGGSELAASYKAVLGAVIKHPRIAAVPRSAVLTDAQPLLSLDLTRARLQDLWFAGRRVALTTQKPGRISGLAAFFELGWHTQEQQPKQQPTQQQQQQQQQPERGGGGVTFSTSPDAPPTSWGQTVLSFPKSLAVAGAGEQLVVEAALRPLGRPAGRMLELAAALEWAGNTATIAYELKR